MNSENGLMAKATNYLIIRDVLLFILIGAHALFYYKLIPRLNTTIIWTLGVGAVVWLAYYAKSVWSYLGMKKDGYLSQAFKDEYYRSVIRKAGYHGYLSVFVVCILLVLFNILMTILSARVDLPYFIVCEGLVFLAVLTDDVSKIVQFSR